MSAYYEQGGILSPMQDSERIYSMIMTMLEPEYSDVPEKDIIYRSILYIRDHAGENLRLQDLADQAALSMYYYSHLFKERTGFSPMDYVANTRIEKAKRLLIETDLSVEDIAAESGYASSAGLIKAFKKTPVSRQGDTGGWRPDAEPAFSRTDSHRYLP